MSTSRGSTPRRIERPGCPAAHLRPPLSEGRFEQEGWRVRKDGTRMWAHVVIDPLYDDDRKPRRFCQNHT